MIKTFIQNYEDSSQLDQMNGVLLGLLRTRIIAGTITRIDIFSGGTITGTAVFNFRVNGTSQFTGANRPTLSPGTSQTTKDNLSIAIQRGDRITLDLDNNPHTSNLFPVTLMIDVEDGVAGGKTTEEIEDIVGAMFQTGANLSFNYNDATGKLELDAIQLSTEEVQDRVAALLVGGANTTVTYNDGANTLTVAETTAGKTTEEIQDIVAALLAQGSNVTLIYDDAANTLTVAASGSGGSGGGTLAGDVTGAIGTNTIEKIQNRTIYLPTASTAYGDDFADNNFNTELWTKYFGSGSNETVVEQNARLETATTGVGGRRAGMFSKETFDFTNKYIKVKIAAISGTGRAIQFGLFNGAVSGTNVEFQGALSKVGFHQGGDYDNESTGMYFGYTIAGVGSDFDSPITGLNTAGTWLRLRHSTSAGNLYFETSTDNSTWTTRRTIALSSLTGFNFTSSRLLLFGGGDNTGSGTAFVAFDDLTSDVTPIQTIRDRAPIIYNVPNARFEPDNDGGSYAINVQALTSAPVDAQTIYFGTLPKTPVTTAGQSKIYIRKTGIIRIAEIYSYSGTAGTSENWSIYIRKNNTTDYLIATVAAAANERVFSNSALAIAVAAGDYIEIKVVNPTWATNPNTTIFGGYIFVQ